MVELVVQFYTSGPLLLLLFTPAPALAMAIMIIARDKAPGWRLAVVALLVSWLTSPIWAGVFIGLGVGMSVHASFLPMLVLAGIPAVMVLLLMWRTLRREIVAISVGVASYVTPVVGVALLEFTGDRVSIVTSALLWNLWVVASLLLKLRPKPGVCHNCGYDLTGLDADRCPECGEACAPARIEAQ